MPAEGSSGLLTASTISYLAFGIVVDDDLERAQHGHDAGGAAVEIFADEVFEQFDVDDAVGLETPMAAKKLRMASGV